MFDELEERGAGLAEAGEVAAEAGLSACSGEVRVRLRRPERRLPVFKAVFASAGDAVRQGDETDAERERGLGADRGVGTAA